MSPTTRAVASEYLAWSKLHSTARFNLATSGIQSYPLSALPVTLETLEINGPTVYGYEPLTERLAETCGVTPAQVFTTNGTSMANLMAMAATLSPGDDVLIEQPAYGALLEVASYVGATVSRFVRRPEDAFQIDPHRVQAQITARTRLIVITNMHNPSGALTGEATLRELGEIASQAGARVLVDEVYLPMARSLEDEPDTGRLANPSTRSAIHLGPEFMVTSSLTKSYGLSGLRCGWVLAEPTLIERLWRLNDLFNANQPFIAEQLSLIALEQLDHIGERSREILRANRPLLNAFLDRWAFSGELDLFRPMGGTICFPRLGNISQFSDLLREQFETSVVPGRFFEMPEHFRIGIGGDPEMTAEGLNRIGEALEQFNPARLKS